MISNPIISIIIPVFNRATLLSMTIESIKAQTFADWECILIDDHSTDNSLEVMMGLRESDARIKTFLRPANLKKGANSCRNFGFLQATGEYIKWFDSDDIMLPTHLEIAYENIVANKLDFVVTDTMNFNHEDGKILGRPYSFDRNNAVITDANLAFNVLGWITDDFLGTRKIVEKIKFNENIIDGDEYNFFVKLLQQPFKCILINEVLTHRRIHNGSITVQNRENQIRHKTIIATLKFQTANDLVFYDNEILIRWFLSGYMQYAFEIAKSKNKVPNSYAAFLLISKYYTISKGLVYLLAINLAFMTGKGYKIMKYART
jgi:glycosyltransferase involved in cell wall biosynthesis